MHRVKAHGGGWWRLPQYVSAHHVLASAESSSKRPAPSSDRGSLRATANARGGLDPYGGIERVNIDVRGDADIGRKLRAERKRDQHEKKNEQRGEMASVHPEGGVLMEMSRQRGASYRAPTGNPAGARRDRRRRIGRASRGRPCASNTRSSGIVSVYRATTSRVEIRSPPAVSRTRYAPVGSASARSVVRCAPAASSPSA